jgi:electron transport complex protein RnfC
VLKTFSKGGVHPPENKIASNIRIEILPLPKQVVIPVSQHIGAPANLVVAKGDKVKVGQILAKCNGFVSTNIHSSVSGTIISIDPTMDSSGFKRQAVTITVEGDEWEPSINRSSELIKEFNLSSEDIISKINESGIVGLGGATFPTHVKLSVPKGKKADLLIVNGVECEPYLTSDHRLMLEKGHEMLVGVTILMKALQVNRAFIGIENNKPDVIEYLQNISKEYNGIEIFALKVKYPQGGEKQLIKALIDREVPSGGLPIDIGVVVHNVGTAYAVYEAIQKNKPLFERVVTITGKSISKPSNFLARIGTPIAELVAAAGGLPEDTGKVINGGPMMGKALNSIEVPVTKGTSGVVVFPANEASRPEATTCIRCAKCVGVCPMCLEPYLMIRMSQRQMFDRLENERILDCMECGSCSFDCPANLPLLDYVRLAKVEVNKLIRARKN